VVSPYLAVVVSVWLAEAPDARLETGRRLTAAFLDNNSAEIWGLAGPAFKQQLGSEQGLKQFRSKVDAQFGEELRVTSEALAERGPLAVYTRQSTFSHWARGAEIEWVWDPTKGVLVSLSVRPSEQEAPSPHEDYVPRVQLRLPFHGTWNVLWGGRTWDENRHTSVADMRYALDLLILKNGTSCKDDCSKNEQYYCWGKPVVAPAAGKVIEVEANKPDNRPNVPDPNNLFGNHVVIDHGHGEFSLLAHLRNGSVLVKVGQTVEVDEIIGLTGNSGMSTEPHLHYQLMDGPKWEHAQGLPPRFYKFVCDMKFVDGVELHRGNIITPRQD
jgi:hypothetical protein